VKRGIAHLIGRFSDRRTISLESPSKINLICPWSVNHRTNLVLPQE